MRILLLTIVVIFFCYGWLFEGIGRNCNKNNTDKITLANYSLKEVNEAYNLQVSLLEAIQSNNIKMLNDIFLFELISHTKLEGLRKNNYELILNQSFKKRLAKSKPDCNSVGARGWMLDYGTVWIQSNSWEGVNVLSVNWPR